ncbi:MAG: terpene cyclase/mutase family protein, partial [Planctomycetes bacterium]|nr:terpene cyclase/mutase family protein [Planctomycetota bacterium]
MNPETRCVLALAFATAVPSLLPAQVAEAPAAATAVDDAPRPAALLAFPKDTGPRDAAVKTHPEVVPTVEASLRWLLAHQGPDGRWDADAFHKEVDTDPRLGKGRATHDVGLTGMVLFALAREGKAAKGDARRTALEKGARWLCEQKGENGLLGTPTAVDHAYDHAIATLGLCSAALVTDDADTLAAAKAAVAHLLARRNPYAVWRYGMRDNDNDSSVTTWATLALLAGREAGIDVDPAVWRPVRIWFQAVTTAEGQAGYTRAGERSSRRAGDHAVQFPPEHGEAMTAAALLVRSALGETTADDGVLGKSIALLADKPPKWDPSGGCIDTCYWFFASEAFRHAGGDARTPWCRELVAALVKGQ